MVPEKIALAQEKLAQSALPIRQAIAAVAAALEMADEGSEEDCRCHEALEQLEWALQLTVYDD